MHSKIIAYLQAARERLIIRSRQGLARPDLEDGLSGYSVALACLMRALGDDEGLDAIVDNMHRSIEALTSVRMPLSYMHGSVGIIWCLEVLSQIDPRIPAFSAEDAYSFVRKNWSTLSEPLEFELLGGLSGVALYMQTVGDPLGSEEEAIAKYLSGLIHKARPEYAIEVPLSSPSRSVNKFGEEKAWDLGIAHGNAGVLLALCGESGSRRHEWRTLAIERLARFFLSVIDSSQQEVSSAGHFWIMGQRRPHIGQLGWCYGDPGIAWALQCSDSYLRPELKPSVRHFCESVSRRIVSMPIESDMDLTVCHGVVGALLLGQAIEEQISESPTLWNSQRERFMDALDAQVRVAGGVLQHRSLDGRTWDRRPGLGLLQGEAGIVTAICALEAPKCKIALTPFLGVNIGASRRE